MTWISNTDSVFDDAIISKLASSDTLMTDARVQPALKR